MSSLNKRWLRLALISGASVLSPYVHPHIPPELHCEGGSEVQSQVRQIAVVQLPRDTGSAWLKTAPVLWLTSVCVLDHPSDHRNFLYANLPALTTECDPVGQ